MDFKRHALDPPMADKGLAVSHPSSRLQTARIKLPTNASTFTCNELYECRRSPQVSKENSVSTASSASKHSNQAQQARIVSKHSKQEYNASTASKHSTANTAIKKSTTPNKQTTARKGPAAGGEALQIYTYIYI